MCVLLTNITELSRVAGSDRLSCVIVSGAGSLGTDQLVPPEDDF